MPAALSLRRRVGGVVLGLLAAVLLTVAMAGVRAELALTSSALLYLPVVVAAAAVGGVTAGLVTAAASDLLLNWYFIPPLHTFDVAQRDHVVVLVVYVVVAAAVAVTVELAGRTRVVAERSRVEAELLGRLAERPAVEQSLPRLLDQVRQTFRLEAVTVEVAGREVARAGEPNPASDASRVVASADTTLVAYGPPTLGADRRLLAQLAGAAARIVESQRLSEQAARARELAEVDRVRSALLAAVGHDLRTPLAGIKAAVSGLRDPSVQLAAGDREELERTIEESADQLDELIANLLDMSRLQAGAVVLRLEPVPLDAVAAKVALRAVTPVDVDVADDLFVRADAGLLERVVANLVDNAARVSASVRVTARRVPDGVGLAVVDTGPGVPAAERERMFRPFQRLDDRSAHAGPGLGLAIARGFTEAMGGTLEPADTPGGGLTMTVTLPAA